MKRTIFVIDDYPDSLHLYVEALTGEGMRPFAFRDPLSALAALREVRPAAILLDWHLPHLTGGDFIRELRARPDVSDVPVIVLTGDGRLSAHETGAQAVLLKPAELSRVLEVVRACLTLSEPRGTALKNDGANDWRIPE